MVEPRVGSPGSPASRNGSSSKRERAPRRKREAGARELALLRERLRRATAELEEARRDQAEFLAKASHELRTPLNAVIGFASLIEQGNHESDEEARDFARRIRLSAEHLLEILNGRLGTLAKPPMEKR